MNTLRDIQRKPIWHKACKMKVRSFTESRDSEHGHCQIFNVTDSRERDEELIYYFDDEQMALPLDEPTEWFDIKWMGNYFRCVPVKEPDPIDEIRADVAWLKKELKLLKLALDNPE